MMSLLEHRRNSHCLNSASTWKLLVVMSLLVHLQSLPTLMVLMNQRKRPKALSNGTLRVMVISHCITGAQGGQPSAQTIYNHATVPYKLLVLDESTGDEDTVTVAAGKSEEFTLLGISKQTWTLLYSMLPPIRRVTSSLIPPQLI